MAYSERIKNFEAIRAYLRDFYVNGFHTRGDFGRMKSGRSYDDAKRRVEDYLGDYAFFRTGPDGKAVYLSMDSRSVPHNPLYRAFLARSFTDRDITLHFYILDILSDGEALSPGQILTRIDLVNNTAGDSTFTEATLRKKLKEYASLGILEEQKRGGQVLYRICEDDLHVEELADAVDYFMEESPIGVIGSYVTDHLAPHESVLRFRNHYFMNACDSVILETILQGIHERRMLDITYTGKSGVQREWCVAPLRLYVNTVGGRSYLVCRDVEKARYEALRADRMNRAEVAEPIPEYEKLKAGLDAFTGRLWGVSGIARHRSEHVEMEIRVDPGEGYIVDRLKREKRHGILTRLDAHRWLFTADVCDAEEMVPWIRSYYGRILRFFCDNRRVQEKVVGDIRAMMEMYGGGDAF